MFLADKDDGLVDARAVMKMEMAKHHAEVINKMLLSDVSNRSTTIIEPNFSHFSYITTIICGCPGLSRAVYAPFQGRT